MSTVAGLLDQVSSLGVATVYEAAGRQGLIDADLLQVVPGSVAAGPAKTVLCGQSDNRAVHEVMDSVRPGDVLILTMPSPLPIALVGELLITQAQVAGAAAVLVDASVRDIEELRAIGLPVWCRWIRSTGATKSLRGQIDVPVHVGGATINPGDVVVLDSDGAVVVPASSLHQVTDRAHDRQKKEEAMRQRLQAGELSYDIHGLRAVDEEVANR